MTDPSKRYWITEQGMKEAEIWKREALALVVLLRAKCSDEEWATMQVKFEAAAHSEAASPPAPQLFSATTTLPDYDATKEIVEGFKSAGINFSTLIWLEREAIAEKAIAPLRAEISRLRELLLPFLAKAASPPQGTPAPETDKCPSCGSDSQFWVKVAPLDHPLAIGGFITLYCPDFWHWHSTVAMQK